MINQVVRALLRSPLHGALGGSCELTYTGRRTGRLISLPVQCSRQDEHLVVYVARSDAKTWWRNFLEPRPVSVRVGGRQRQATGRVLLPGDPERGPWAETYRRDHPKARVDEGPLVLVNLEPTPRN